jgi:hypothetical protein
MQSLAIKNGIIMFAGFAALFLILYVFGAAEYVNLRSLNVFIHFGVMYALIKAYRRAYPETLDNYVKGTIVGMLASTVGVMAFATLVFFTLELDSNLLGELQARSPMPQYVTPFNSAVYLTVEGLVVSLIGAYIVTRIVDARYDRSPAEGKVTQSITTSNV